MKVRGGERGGRSRSSASRFNYKALAAGLIVVFGGGIAVWLVSGRPEASAPVEDKAKKSSQIVEVEAAKVNPAEEKPKKYADLTREEKLDYFRKKYGDNLPENLKPIVYYLENPPKRTFAMPKRAESVFKRHSERTIAAFMMMEPGTWMMKTPEFDARFDVDLAAALGETIEITDEDNEEQRELKLAVIDAKKELAERIKNGEKASEIMTDTARQMYELGKYKRDLEEQVAEVRRNADYSDQELADYVDAANKMLEKKGLRPLRMPNMALRRIGIKQRAARAAQKAKEENAK